MVSVQCHSKTRKVANVLAKGQFAVDVNARERFIPVVLGGQAGGGGLKFCKVGGRPPIVERAGVVEL